MQQFTNKLEIQKKELSNEKNLIENLNLNEKGIIKRYNVNQMDCIQAINVRQKQRIGEYLRVVPYVHRKEFCTLLMNNQHQKKLEWNQFNDD